MQNFKIDLPKELRSNHGKQNKVEFEMSHRHYIINGVEFDNPLSQYIGVNFKGYLATVMNTHISVTLFYESDVLETV